VLSSIQTKRVHLIALLIVIPALIIGLLMVKSGTSSVVQADPPTATPTFAPTITPEIVTPTPGNSPTPLATVDMPTAYPIETDIPIP